MVKLFFNFFEEKKILGNEAEVVQCPLKMGSHKLQMCADVLIFNMWRITAKGTLGPFLQVTGLV